jgi:hypothetical protein
MFIASEYKPGSCNYNAQYAHEYKHYMRYARIFTEYQQKVKQVLEHLATSTTSPALPTRAHPVWVLSELEATNYKESLIRSSLNPVFDSLRAELKASDAALDTPEEYDAVLSLCEQW